MKQNLSESADTNTSDDSTIGGIVVGVGGGGESSRSTAVVDNNNTTAVNSSVDDSKEKVVGTSSKMNESSTTTSTPPPTIIIPLHTNSPPQSSSSSGLETTSQQTHHSSHHPHPFKVVQLNNTSTIPLPQQQHRNNSSIDSFSSMSISPSTPSTASSIITVNSNISSSYSDNRQFVNTNFTFGSSGSLALTPTTATGGVHSPNSAASLHSSASIASSASTLIHNASDLTQNAHFSMPVERSTSGQGLTVDTSRTTEFLPATKLLTGESNSSFGSLINGTSSSQKRLGAGGSTPGSSVLSIRSVGSNIMFVPSPSSSIKSTTQISPNVATAVSSSVSFSANKGGGGSSITTNMAISDPLVMKGTEYYHHNLGGEIEEQQLDDFNNESSSTFKEVDLNQQDLTSVSDEEDGSSSHRDSFDTTGRKSVELLLKDMPTSSTSKSSDFYRERLWRHFTKTNIAFGVFNLINDVLSPATISSGYTVAQSGIGAYVLTLLVVACLIFFTLVILYDMANAHKVTSFPSLVKKTFGSVGYILICVFIFLFNFGAVCSELIEISQILPDLLSELIGTESMFISRYAVLVYVTIILLPIASMKQISSFKYASLISVTSVALISILLTYELGLGRRTVPYNDSVFDFVRPQYLSAMGTLSFVFICHDVSFEVIGSLKNNTRKRYMILVFCMLVLAVGVLLLLGLSSFLLFFDVNLKDANVLDLLPKNYGLAIVARIILCVSLALSISYTCFMPRFALKSVIKTILKQFDEVKQQKEQFKPSKPFTNDPVSDENATETELSTVVSGSGGGGAGKDSEEDNSSSLIINNTTSSENTKRKNVILASISRFFSTRTGKDTLHYGTTLIVVLSAFAVAMLVQNLGVIIGLTGAISATTIAYIFPSLTYIVLERRERKEMMAKLIEKQDYEMIKHNSKDLGKSSGGGNTSSSSSTGGQNRVKPLALPWTRRATVAMCYVVLLIGFTVLVSSFTSIIYYAVV